MNVRIIGSGGREHAICYMLNKSKKVSKIFCFPGNAGTCLIAHNIKLDPDNFSELEEFCVKKKIKMCCMIYDILPYQRSKWFSIQNYKNNFFKLLKIYSNTYKIFTIT